MNMRFQDALTARRKQLAEGEGQKGFTLIELLVVVIIIGILAAIAIPVFLNLREGAWRSSVESDVKNTVLAVEAFAIENNGSVANAGNATTGAKVVQSEGNTITVTVTAGQYTIVGSNINILTGDRTLTYSSSTGKSVWTATAPAGGTGS